MSYETPSFPAGSTTDVGETRAPVITVKDWIITLIILAIPLVNIIMLFVWAFGEQTNPSKRNYAKASLLLAAIFIVLYIVLLILIFVVFGISGLSSYSSLNPR